MSHPYSYNPYYYPPPEYYAHYRPDYHYYPPYYPYMAPYPNPYPPPRHPEPHKPEQYVPREPIHEKRVEISGDETVCSAEDMYSLTRRGTKRIYSCNECLKEFTRAFNCKDHYIATHLQLKPFACPFVDCPSKFARKNDCIRHMRLVHKGIKSLD
jgi:hypothetical protein